VTTQAAGAALHADAYFVRWLRTFRHPVGESNRQARYGARAAW
jgi:hypothetical protein